MATGRVWDPRTRLGRGGTSRCRSVRWWPGELLASDHSPLVRRKIIRFLGDGSTERGKERFRAPTGLPKPAHAVRHGDHLLLLQGLDGNIAEPGRTGRRLYRASTKGWTVFPWKGKSWTRAARVEEIYNHAVRKAIGKPPICIMS